MNEQKTNIEIATLSKESLADWFIHEREKLIISSEYKKIINDFNNFVKSKERVEKIKHAIPELKDEYYRVNNLFGEAFSRIFNGKNTEFDSKYCNLAPELLQTIGYILGVLEE